jgi:NAD(P)H-flavin reductase
MTTAVQLPQQVVNPWLPRPVAINQIVPEAPNVATYHLRYADATRTGDYAFAPGQFNMLYVPGCGESAISMSGTAPGSGAFVHTVRRAGQVTSALARMSVGDQLAVRGPYGRPWPLARCQGQDVILLAGGIGLPPLRPAIYEILARRGNFGRVVVLYGARTAADLLFQKEFDAWRAGGIEVQTTVDRATAGWNGNVGVVPLLFQRWQLARPQQTVVLACGPDVMMRYAALEALQRRIPAPQIHVSLERHMQCAVGLCGHCQLGPALVCRDGPVFSWDQAARLLAIHDW